MNFRAFKNTASTILISAGVLIVLTSNVLGLSKEIKKINELKRSMPFQVVGFPYTGLSEVFKDSEYVGFHTDKDIDNDPKFAMDFTQAQYIVAPAILDLNNLDHRYILFDCTSDILALRKIQQIGAKPLRRNSFGIILAEREEIKD